VVGEKARQSESVFCFVMYLRAGALSQLLFLLFLAFAVRGDRPQALERVRAVWSRQGPTDRGSGGNHDDVYRPQSRQIFKASTTGPDPAAAVQVRVHRVRARGGHEESVQGGGRDQIGGAGGGGGRGERPHGPHVASPETWGRAGRDEAGGQGPKRDEARTVRPVPSRRLGGFFICGRRDDWARCHWSRSHQRRGVPPASLVPSLLAPSRASSSASPSRAGDVRVLDLPPSAASPKASRRRIRGRRRRRTGRLGRPRRGRPGLGSRRRPRRRRSGRRPGSRWRTPPGRLESPPPRTQAAEVQQSGE
jgi:hypothetical protein